MYPPKFRWVYSQNTYIRVWTDYKLIILRIITPKITE